MAINLLLDSADPKIWEELIPIGIFNGITTNPSLLKKANQKCTFENLKKLSLKAVHLKCNQLHIQAWGDSTKELIKCGEQLGKLKTLNTKIFVKLPITRIGIEAASELITSNIPVTFTACYELKQVIIASAIGADFIAPYLGRINDNGRDGINEILEMHKVLSGLKSKCQILLASIRSLNEINYLASHGINTFTINYKIARELFKSDETCQAAEKFNADAKLSLNPPTD